jgi:HPt (histidine-containing phosphotransfer) domain-containing protein
MYLDAGFDDYLTKPIEVEQLERILKKYLSGKAFINSNETVIPDDTDDDGSEYAWDPDEEDASGIKPCTDETLQKLEAAGINTAAGLDYCAGERDIYAEILVEYANDHDEKSSLLKQYYEEKNWDEYRIIIHSLKSASKTVGAEDASDLAKKLEDASGEHDAAFIEANHEEFLKLYDALFYTVSKELKE